MKKVYITTYCHDTSYGSVLQSFAFKKTLLSLGLESEIIETELKGFKPYENKISGKLTLKKFIVYISKFLHYKKSAKKIEKMQSFIKENIDITFRDYDDLCGAFSDEDIFISGSDQVFHPVKLSKTFFLDFAPEKAKKISYAASMCNTNIPTENVDTLKKFLENFNSLSVRENDVADILSDYTQKPVYVNIDPVFLYGKNSWQKLEKPYKIKKPYVLVYAIYWDHSLNEQLKKLHKEYDVDIVAVSNTYRDIYADKWIFDAGLEEFLWLVDNAQGVVSSSFHGIAMALCFNKNVSAVIEPQQPSRIENLLAVLNYKNLNVSDLLSSKVDFKSINSVIEKEKEKALSYLKDNLL